MDLVHALTSMTKSDIAGHASSISIDTANRQFPDYYCQKVTLTNQRGYLRLQFFQIYEISSFFRKNSKILQCLKHELREQKFGLTTGKFPLHSCLIKKL